MKTVTRKLAKAKRISVNCCQNDPVDMRCGGPPILGFDFYVDVDEDMKGYVKHIKKKLKEHRVPLMGIVVSKEEHEIPIKSLWTEEMISKCIERDGPSMR
jgi:hypothetical protein